MLPLTGQPAVHCSTTRSRSCVGLPGRSRPPHVVRYVPTPASRRRRFVIGEFQVACCTSSGMPSPVPAASGEVVALPPDKQDVQVLCRSQKTPILLRGVSCHVRRTCALFHVPSS